MVQATHQGGSAIAHHPWKQQINSTYNRFKCADVSSGDAYMDEIDPSLVQVGERLHLKQRRVTAQVETTYYQTDTSARRTFVSDERHLKVTAEMIAEKFGISIP
jgi:hypothetical protein